MWWVSQSRYVVAPAGGGGSNFSLIHPKFKELCGVRQSDRHAYVCAYTHRGEINIGFPMFSESISPFLNLYTTLKPSHFFTVTSPHRKGMKFLLSHVHGTCSEVCFCKNEGPGRKSVLFSNLINYVGSLSQK